MTQSEIIKALETLGSKLSTITSEDDLVTKAQIENQWFTPSWQLFAFKYWASQLNSANLNQWVSNYKFTNNPKKVGLIMAGNIPLVGMHDLISILISGHIALVKPSSDDKILTPWIIEQLISIDPRFKEKIIQVEKLNSCEALIATGSNNTARYFEYYFSKVPKIIRNITTCH